MNSFRVTELGKSEKSYTILAGALIHGLGENEPYVSIFFSRNKQKALCKGSIPITILDLFPFSSFYLLTDM